MKTLPFRPEPARPRLADPLRVVLLALLFFSAGLLGWWVPPAVGQGPVVESVAAEGGGELRVEAGGSAAFTLRGRNLQLLESAAVLLERRPSRGLDAELAPPGRRSRGGMRTRKLTVTASADATPGDGYTLRLLARKYRFARTVASLEVTAAARGAGAGGKRTADRAPRRPAAKAPTTDRRPLEVRAAERASEMMRRRAPAADVANEMRASFRRTAGQTASILKELRVPEAAIASALAEGLGASHVQVAAGMREAGLPSEATARALQEGLGLSTAELAVTLRDGLRLSREAAEATLRATDADRRGIEDALDLAGFDPPAPGIQRYWIRDYRLGASSGAIIENEGIVDRFVVAVANGTEPETTDGQVWIEGTALDRPDTEVFANTQGGTPLRGEILERTRQGGVDRLLVRFDRIPGPGLMVRHSGGEVYQDSKRLAYYLAREEVVEEPLQDLDLRLGSPEGQVSLAVAGLSATLELPPHRESGMEVILTDIRNDGFSLASDAAPNGCALVLTVPFRETGREFRGTFAAYIPVWKCADFEVPRAECGFLDLFCFASYLGRAVASLGADCATLDAWEEEEVLDLPGVAFQGDLHDASVEVRMEVATDGSGRLVGQNASYSFDSGISIVGPSGDIPLSAIEGYLSGRVTETLDEALQSLDLAARLAGEMNQAVDGAAASLGSQIRIRGIQPDPQGRPRIFLDIEL